MGLNVLLVDQRSHGESEGRLITFGVKERRDVVTWIDYVLEHFGDDTEIFLSGLSMPPGAKRRSALWKGQDMVWGIWLTGKA